MQPRAFDILRNDKHLHESKWKHREDLQIGLITIGLGEETSMEGSTI